MKKLAPFLFAFVTIIGIAVAPTLTHAVDSQMCYDLYQPVCAAKPVECFAAPCYPVYTTYSNSCFMQSDNATLIHEGVCTSTETGSFTAGAPVVSTGSATSSPITPPSQPVTPPVITTPPHFGPGPVIIKPHPPTTTVTASTSVTASTTATSTPASTPSFFSRLWHTIIGWFGFH